MENLIGISQQGVLEKSDEEVEVENSVATVNIAPDVIIDDNDLPVNLVPYVDTDSDCDSVEDHEKRVAASRRAAESISNDAPAVISALDMDAFKVEGQRVTIKVDHGELMASKKSSQPSSLLKKVTGQKVSIKINFKTGSRTERSVSSDAQIVCLEESEEIEQPDEIEVDEFIKQIEAKDNPMDIERSEIKTVAMEASVSVTTSAGICDFLAAEVSPSQEEVNRAMERVKRNSGEECSGIKFSLLGKLGKSPSKLLGSPRGNSKDELVNFSPHSQRKEDEYAFPVDFGKSDPEVGSYQSLVRPGKPGRKKPCKSAFSHETEETQMQADIARQEQEKRINRTRLGVVGKTAAGSSFIQPGCSVLRAVQPTSVIRPVPRQTPAAQQPGHTGASAQLLRHIIPQPQDQMQFITIPSTTPHQLHQSSKRPPTVQNMQSFDAKAAGSDQAESDVLASPAEPDIWLSRHKNEPHRTYSRPRRSTEAIDHSYVMDMDEDDFDLSEKLDEMEKDFDTSESPENMVQEESHDNMVKEESYENIIPEESLENIKDLLDSQVASQESSSTPNKSESTISLSSGDDLGLYSPGDDHIPEPSVMDDPIQHNSPVISIRTDVSAEEISDIILPVKPFDKTIQDKEVKVSPYKKSQDETYDDVDDLLGDSDDDDDDIEEKREPVPVPMIKVALPSEPVPVPMIKVALPSEPSRKKPPKFVCPECNQKYGKNEAQYNNHIRQKHNFPCKYCPLRFTYVNGLEEHLNSVHINETAKANSTSFCCNICNKSFTRQGPYLKHKKRDHNIPCIECDMVFTNEPFLEEHMASMHGINSPPTGKVIKMRKPTSPVEVKFQLANGMINDSPKKIKPRDETLNEGIGSKKEPLKKASFKMEASKKSKASKSIFKSIKDISVLSEDDTICEKCGQKFVELEAFEHHIELPHEHQCGMKNCELSFVFQYYLDLHIYLEHKTGIKPDERDKPIEESVHVAASSHNDVSMEDQISLADLAVSEDYLPGIGPQSLMCGVDAAKLKSLKNYKIPKKSASPVELDKSIERSLNSSWSSHDGSPVNVNNHFSTDKNFEQHTATHHNGGKTYLGSPSGSSLNNLKCHECNLTFGDRQGLDDHVSSHYNPSTSRQASGNKKLKCPLCNQYFEEMVKMMDHLRAKHGSGKIEKKHDFWCGLCRKGFETEKKFEDHEKLDHKYGCKHCHKAYILEVDLNHHVEKSHKVQTKYKEGFTCQLCGVNVSEMETFKIHQSQGHNVPCYLDGCDRRFQHKKELLSHLKTQHNVVQIRIGDDSEEEHRGYLTTERSQANIDIAEWAESWIDSPLAVEHMKKVMKGVVKSRRHDLFLDKREREQCSGSETSRLYQLSNPGFLGGGGEKDTVVIKHLIDRVFMEYFHEADTRLMELGNGTAFVYTSCVLFPETFIHQHQVQGKSREEAEQAFMEVAVDVEERKGLNQEIKEAAVQNRRDNDEDSGDEWVDHSDMEDDLDE